MGVAMGAPVKAAEPAAKTAPVAVADTELQDATRLMGEVERLSKEGKYDEALVLAERALAIREKALGLDHPDVASSATALANLYYFKADQTRAEPLHQRALAIREKALGLDHPDVSNSLNNLGNVYRARGDNARAELMFLRALTIREKAFGLDHLRVADVLNNLAVVYIAKADYARAEPLYQRSLAIREKSLGPDNIRVADALNNLGDLYRLKGDYVRAEPLCQRALAIIEKVLGPHHPDMIVPLNNLAINYFSKGDYARAMSLHQRALAICEKALGLDDPRAASSLSNLGLIYAAKGDFARAEPLYLRALAINEKALGRDHFRTAIYLNNLGGLYQDQGDYARAEPLLTRALDIREKTYGPDHPNVANSLHSLADLYVGKRDYVRADPLFQRALAIFEKALGPDHPDVAVIWGAMALSFAAQSRPVDAVNAAQWATAIQDRNAAALLATGSEEQKRLYMDKLVGQTHQNISLHLQYARTNMDAARLAFTALLRRKGRVLETMTNSLAALRQSLAPADQALIDQLASVYSQLATQLSHGLGNTLPEQYRKNVTALEDERQKLEADIGKQSASFRIEKRIVTIEDVQSAIPRNAALLEITRYEPIRFPSTTDPHPKSKPRYAAYVLRSSGDPAFVDLGEAAPLEAAIKTLRRALSDPDLTHDPKPAARALDQLLMQPIRKLLGDTRWVFVSADGPTHLVPLAALVDENDHYLVERYLFSYVNTGRDLLRFAEEPTLPRQGPWVFANPAFDDSGASPGPEATHRGLHSIDMVTQRLLPLGGTVEEAETIHTLFPESRLLMGVDATEEALKAVHAPRILHLATHGFFLPERPVPEVLLRTASSEPTAAERAAILQRENPLLRSGLALAGFNDRRSGVMDDGILTALEAAGLDLYGTRLVVLSACETGVGQASSGEGVYGLRRALSMAGAETQVMSLWQVDTGRTRELMQSYYGWLKGKGGRSESMRNVQVAMLSNPQTSHPNLWASFIVSGDWRALEGDAVLPDLAVHPGPRGCACTFAGESTEPNGYWMGIAIGLAATRRLRNRISSGYRA